MAQRPPTLTDLINSLTTHSLPTPTTAFLQPILTPPSSSTSFRQPPPLAALTATAKHRLLSASILPSPTNPSILIPSTPSLPTNISDVRIKECAVPHDVFLQVVDIQDLGRSKWEQIEGLEAERKGETTKGREVIRVIPATGEENDPSSAATQFPTQGNTQNQTSDKSSRGPFKLLLSDFKGTTIWGFELRKVEKIGLPPLMGIGCKVLVRRGAKVARGVVLLEPGTVVVLGGKVDAEDKAWRAGREERLRREVKEEAERAREGGEE
ncbi:hypothetical protein ONS95_014096 [Cadophora gregata]|uniref:uncharacterized protein n=1 Tax=Cadophora gregata TaxID=51156 RepID=UPI0026DDA32F|nr:uncharacterized protein ONS95_014096 [Cadophora gregata]KAK0113850.1 hypothetical protein ONS96_014702 [Cadophora gregata f. sp. sojae]KAK0114611.1 hypothetical protein ONS95_014096 [Cadophora gregata]